MIPDLSEKYWNNLYLNNQSIWDVGAISTPLKQYFDQLTNKNTSILIPGAGNAYEAEYLIKNGFVNVYVCDFAEEPLKNLEARGVKIKKQNLLQIDFFEIKNLRFDIIIEQTFFCALQPSLRQKYFEKINQLLKPCGKLVGVLFNCEFNTDTAPFGGTAEEYKQYFRDLLKVNVFEFCYNSIKPREGRELFINLEKEK